MLQWVNDVLLLLVSVLSLDKLVDYANQSRVFLIYDILLRRKPSLANRLGLTHDIDAQANELVSMTIQAQETRRDEAFLRDQMFHLNRRLRRFKIRESVALIKCRAWQERKQFLLREKDKQDKQIQEQRKSMQQQWANHCDEMKSLKQTLSDTLREKAEMESEVGSLQDEIKSLEKALKAKSQGVENLKIVRSAISEEVEHSKAQLENTKRRLEAIDASHSRFMVQRRKTLKALKARAAKVRFKADQVELICYMQEKVNQVTRMRVDSLREHLDRLHVDLVPQSEVILIEQRRYKLVKILKRMCMVLLIEGLVYLVYFLITSM
ncbi:uncharacterized protein LOC110978367 isoform X1 [Acanthaster planci]|uniref:Uncharacterized protein LOC110978367 isoform X1 n=1 Tax=Acanthaster planci TaxID=133434 RepID=A0A8B7Y8Y3_ACAPL|nr:uncharacterized protein LOC110978367 isoform X1 [Acanthaster planci]XP_022089002.1 uncharacterized protein LOC110978367 isoform X1 [Acanthaster planci]